MHLNEKVANPRNCPVALNSQDTALRDLECQLLAPY